MFVIPIGYFSFHFQVAHGIRKSWEVTSKLLAMSKVKVAIIKLCNCMIGTNIDYLWVFLVYQTFVDTLLPLPPGLEIALVSVDFTCLFLIIVL